jgi:DNA-binding NtrC family response regulator
MESTPWDVVVVSSSLENRQDVAGMLSRLGLDAICASTVSQCRELAKRDQIGLVFCDRQVKDGDYRDILAAIAPSPSKKAPKVVMMADIANPIEYQQLRNNGLFDVISSPCRPTDIEWMVILARRNHRQVSEHAEPKRSLSLLWKAAGAGA